MTRTIDPLAEAIADAEGVEGIPGAFTDAFARAGIAPAPEAVGDIEKKPRELVIICYSGDLEKTWAALILASTAAASGMPTRIFLTFWGLQTFVKDEVRITGKNWMQKMMSVMQRPGISHRKLSKMNFLGMGPWMMGTLAKQYGVAKPGELLEACQAIERAEGRTRGARWASRSLDLDIIRYGRRTVAEPGLTIPHPELPNRDFWQRGLAEVERHE